jgi:hypothetical protein
MGCFTIAELTRFVVASSNTDRICKWQEPATSPTCGSMLPSTALASKIVYHHLANGEGLHGTPSN